MSFSIVFNTSNDAGLAQLNSFLAARSYIVGFAPSKADVALVAALGAAPNKDKFPHLWRYYTHINALPEGKRASLPEGVTVSSGAAAAAAPAAAKGGAGGGKPAAAPAAAKDDDESDGGDLFGDDDEDDDAAAIAAAKKKAEEAAGKKGKKVVIAKTSVIWEVKPVEAGQDMKALETAVRSVAMDGLLWGEEFKVEDVAFGIQKLIAQAVIEDDKVAVDDVEAAICAFEDQVQSVDIKAMNKV